MFTLNCQGRLLTAHRPLIMGIINVTPDSFFAGSRVKSTDELLSRTRQMLDDGADILDIGAQSTRPGSEAVTVTEELTRLMPVISLLAEEFPEAILSVDTYYAVVARAAADAGAHIINDISGGQLDDRMFATVASLGLPYVLTHTKGSPQEMSNLGIYQDMIPEMLDYFTAKIAGLRTAGVKDIILDPGFGFAKNASQNFRLLASLEAFSILGLPVLAGISRKGMIHKTLGIAPTEALNGTTALHMVCLQQGAQILRVHDVREAAETIRLFQALQAASLSGL